MPSDLARWSDAVAPYPADVNRWQNFQNDFSQWRDDTMNIVSYEESVENYVDGNIVCSDIPFC